MSPSSPQRSEVGKDHVLVMAPLTVQDGAWHQYGTAGISNPTLNA